MSDILDMVKATYAKAVEETNAIADKILAATTDRTKLVHEIREEQDTQDETILKFREWRDKVLSQVEENTTKVNAYIEQNKMGAGLSEADVDALKEQYKTGKSQVQAAIKFAETVPDYSEEAFKDVPELKSLRGGTSGGSGSGGRRPRFERLSFSTSAEGPWTEVDKDGKTNLTLVALRLSSETKTKVEVKDLQAAAFDAAKTDDLSTLNGAVFTFAHNVGDKTYWVKAQPAVKSVEESVEESVETPTENSEATVPNTEAATV